MTVQSDSTLTDSGLIHGWDLNQHLPLSFFTFKQLKIIQFNKSNQKDFDRFPTQVLNILSED